jgi:hypothetical protein
MGRLCSVCQHPACDAIDEALVDNAAFRPLVAKYSVSAFALARHKAAHLPATLAKAADAAEAARADDLLGEALRLQQRLERIADKAETAEHWPSAIAALSAVRGYLELRAKLRGELDEGNTTNIVISPEYVTVRTRLIAALAPFPDARLAAVAALGEVSGG